MHALDQNVYSYYNMVPYRMSLNEKSAQVYRRALMLVGAIAHLSTMKHFYNACALNNFPRYIEEH